MIDLTRISPEQANRIECALIMLEGDVKDNIETYYKLTNRPDLEEDTILTLVENAKWWEGVYKLIYGKEYERND